jgi:anti-anti-sigma regulatory factor
MEDFINSVVGDIVVEKVNKLNATSKEAQPCWERLQEDINYGYTKIIVDLSDCTLVDSTFIGAIVKAKKLSIERNCQLKLVLPKNHCIEVIKYAGITKVISSFHSTLEALESFKETPLDNQSVISEPSLVLR